jgi:hypothetical protein
LHEDTGAAVVGGTRRYSAVIIEVRVEVFMVAIG